MASGNVDGLGYKMVTQDSNFASTDSGRDSGASLPCPYSNSQSAPMRNDNNAPPGALEQTIRLSGGNSSNTPETDADTLPLRETKCACPYSNSQSAPMRNDNNAPPGAL